METTMTVRDNPERRRYELLDGDELVGIADYVVQGDRVVMPHTVIDPMRRGQGLGAQLVAGALDDIRRAGRTVVPRCWYVAEFIDAHPGYADLLAPRD
jgi:predicted GNAT family acetyltransferase